MIEERHVKRLWAVMQERYGGAWTHSFGYSTFQGQLGPVAAAWLRTFNDEGITPEMIAEALKGMLQPPVAKKHPNLPEFLQACKRHGKPEVPAIWARAYEEDRKREAQPKPQKSQVGTGVLEKALKAAMDHNGKRALFSKGYGWDEYRADCRKAAEEGRPLYEVDMEAMARNGWTEEDEARYREAWLSLPGQTVHTLYPVKHAPDGT